MKSCTKTRAGGSALNGFSEVGFSSGCRTGSVSHGSNRSVVLTSSSACRFPMRNVSSS